MLFLDKEAKIYKSFVISICLIVTLSLSGVFLGMTIRTRTLIMDELISHSRAYFETIVATRLWNANYGGVYVEKKPGVQSNPYYPNPDLQTKDGRTFTIRNPAMMTREVSEYIGKDKDFSFHITSDKLINPSNKADAFEQRALALFEKGQKEVYEVEKTGEKQYFRYMGVLHIKKDCLKCHAHQDYKEGDVRGGISVTYNIDSVSNKLQTNAMLIGVFALTTTSLLLTVLWILTRRLMQKIIDVRKQIEEMAVTDMLTGIYNRRFLMQRFEEEFDRARRQKKEFGCMLLDIDRFKNINDTHGHQTGDAVLVEVARIIRNGVRKYDLAARYGGEEFMVLLPDTDLDNSAALAERIAQAIRQKPVAAIPVTVSIGVSVYQESDKSVDDMIRRADELLYVAKESGRDCVRKRMES